MNGIGSRHLSARRRNFTARTRSCVKIQHLLRRWSWTTKANGDGIRAPFDPGRSKGALIDDHHENRGFEPICRERAIAHHPTANTPRVLPLPKGVQPEPGVMTGSRSRSGAPIRSGWLHRPSGGSLRHPQGLATAATRRDRSGQVHRGAANAGCGPRGHWARKDLRYHHQQPEGTMPADPDRIIAAVKRAHQVLDSVTS